MSRESDRIHGINEKNTHFFLPCQSPKLCLSSKDEGGGGDSRYHKQFLNTSLDFHMCMSRK